MAMPVIISDNPDPQDKRELEIIFRTPSRSARTIKSRSLKMISRSDWPFGALEIVMILKQHLESLEGNDRNFFWMSARAESVSSTRLDRRSDQRSD